MKNYVVTYTIADDNARISFEKYLFGLGIAEETDQSTRYGSFNGNEQELKKYLQSAIKTYILDKTDTITLYYAKRNSDGECSVFIIKV